MDIQIQTNVESKKEYIVTEKDTAIAIGSGEVNVLATPKLLSLMEEVSSKSVKDLLPEGYVSVGVEMNILHLKSTKVGEKITIHSTFSRQEGKKLYFDVVATNANNETIGTGECNRVIVNKEKFENK
jgi:fluoroacetyl-CoA thioesterase